MNDINRACVNKLTSENKNPQSQVNSLDPKQNGKNFPEDIF